jgi:hypothetical protein
MVKILQTFNEYRSAAAARMAGAFRPKEVHYVLRFTVGIKEFEQLVAGDVVKFNYEDHGCKVERLMSDIGYRHMLRVIANQLD